MQKILRKTHWLLITLWLFSFTTHFYYFLQNRTFSQDQARDIMIADDLIQKGSAIIGYGPKASVGDFYLPPLYYYVQVIVRLIFPWPLAMGAVITLVESFTPIFLFLILKKLFNQRAGIVGALLYSVSPIVLAFATFMWNPNMIPFFTTIALWCVIEWLDSKRTDWLVFLSLAVTVAVHLHYQTFVILPFYIGFFLWTFIRQPESRKAWLIGVAIGVSSFIPYVWQEQHSNWQNTQAIIHYFRADHAQTYERVSKPGYILTFLPSFFGRLLLSNEPNWSDKVLTAGRILFWFGGAGLLGTVLIRLKDQTFSKYLKKGNLLTTQRLLLLFYVGSVLLALRLYKGDKIDYYLSTCFVFPPIFAVVLDKISPRKMVNNLIIGFIVVIAGFTFAKSTAVSKNTLRDTQVIFQEIQAIAGAAPILLMPHHQDMHNVITYGLRYEVNLQIDELAPTYLAQVCYTGGACFGFEDNLCKHYPDLEKLGLTYDLPSSKLISVKEIETQAYTVLVSRVVVE